MLELGQNGGYVARYQRCQDIIDNEVPNDHWPPCITLPQCPKESNMIVLYCETYQVTTVRSGSINRRTFKNKSGSVTYLSFTFSEKYDPRIERYEVIELQRILLVSWLVH